MENYPRAPLCEENLLRLKIAIIYQPKRALHVLPF